MGKGTSIFKAIQWYRRQEPFDLVIDQHHGLPWYAPWWSGTNCIAYIHEVLGPVWKVIYHWPLNRIGQWQERWTHWLYRAVPFWTPSESTKIVLHRHGVREVRVFPNGTDLSSDPKGTAGRPVHLRSHGSHHKRVEHALSRGFAPERDTIVGTGRWKLN